MLWAFVFGGIAVGSIALLVCYVIWMWHKISDLYSEIEMLGKRAQELGELVAKLELPTN